MRIVIAAAVVVVLLVLGMVGLVLRHESGKQAVTASASGAPGAKVETISRGEMVDLKAHLATGQWTVVEFTADW